MDAALLLELGDDYSPRAPGVGDLVQVLVSWQWCVFFGGDRSAYASVVPWQGKSLSSYARRSNPPQIL